MTAGITGIGTALPERVVTNGELEARLDTTDEWIVERTGIRERRAATTDDDVVSLAITAGAAAVKDAGLVPDDVDILIVATTSADQRMPAASAFVQDGLGLRCGAFDVSAACAGFVYSLISASTMLSSGAIDTALVVGAETMTRIVDEDDRSTYILFGDGAGAVVLQRCATTSPDTPRGLIGWDVGCDGSAAGILEIPIGERFVRMDGKEVFRRAVRVLVESSRRALANAGAEPGDVDWFVPHQANLRIIEAAATRLGIAPERVVVNIERLGNTSAASIPLALADTPASDGDLVLMSGFGAGMTWATAAVRWGAA